MIAVFLIGAALVLLLHSVRFRREWSRQLCIRVHFSSPHLYAGEIVELTETIENRKKLPLPVMEIGFRVPKGLRFEDAENTLESDYIYKRDLFAVRGEERIVRRYHVSALKRGRYTVSQLSCQVPSGLFLRSYRIYPEPEAESSLYVYAANVNCDMLLRPVEVLLGELECARRLYEDPFVFSSIRPYTPQDPQRSVNWKATAKTGELMINTYASTSAIRVRIYLDVSTDPGHPFSESSRELGIALAASLIRNLVTSQKDASLILNCTNPVYQEPGTPSAAKRTLSSGQPAAAGKAVSASSGKCMRFESCAGARQLTEMEESLTMDFNDCSLLSLIPFEEMLRQEKTGCSLQRAGLTSRSEVSVFLTSSDTPSLRRTIHDLLGIQQSGILAVLSRTADARPPEKEGNLSVFPVYETTGMKR